MLALTFPKGETAMASVLRLNEVADYLRVHPSTIYRLLRKKQLPAFKVGSDWRFNLESIDQWRDAAERTAARSGSSPAKADDANRKRLTPPTISRSV
jgi:excisionase family DNA binding protein